MMNENSPWAMPVSLWVSRKTADGVISNFTVPMWLFMMIGVLILLNVLGWGIVGIIELVQYVWHLVT